MSVWRIAMRFAVAGLVVGVVFCVLWATRPFPVGATSVLRWITLVLCPPFVLSALTEYATTATQAGIATAIVALNALWYFVVGLVVALFGQLVRLARRRGGNSR